ncbi:MAG: Fmu (Sun) domain-containing protein [Ginsengibacter sp.]
MKYFSYLATSAQILQQYKGQNPFAVFTREFFKSNKKYGSTDRKQITSLCYNCFRLGHAAHQIPVDERILLGTFLCEKKSNELLLHFKPQWNLLIEKSIDEKFVFLGDSIDPGSVFPYRKELSDGMDFDKFTLSFLLQPMLFLRARPGKKELIDLKLKNNSIEGRWIGEDCLELPNGSKIEAALELDKDAVVQDYNSQRVGKFMKQAIAAGVDKRPGKRSINVWDCCAASGGKSIMAFDIDPSISLTVSDIRSSILESLAQRFKRAGIIHYTSFEANLSEKIQEVGHGFLNKTLPGFDLVIADVPCTGSGTWSRTPEHLFYFNPKKIKEYSILQKEIVTNAASKLKPGGHLLYITCSVFKKENEDIVDHVQKNLLLTLQVKELLKGYEMRADTLFVALFTKT